ncbi:MAG: hypothetical protein ACI9VF_003438, partial [Alteromonas macleodii]
VGGHIWPLNTKRPMKYIGRFNRNKCQPISGLVSQAR